MPEDMKDRFIREAENLVNAKRKRRDELLEEAEQVEKEMNEAREVLTLLKSGPKVMLEMKKVTAENGHKPESPKKRKAVRLEEDTLVMLLKPLGDFDTDKGAAVTGMTRSALATRLRTLAERRRGVILVKEAQFKPGVGNTPSIWRISS